jgi:hypothetical protein
MKHKFYRIEHDIDRLGEDGLQLGDGSLSSEFKDWGKMKLAFSYPIKIDLAGDEGVIVVNRINKKLCLLKAQMPSELLFTGFECLFGFSDGYIDYPYLVDTESWPVISTRMLNALLSVHDFPHQAIPVVFKVIEDYLSTDEEKRIASLVHNHEFAILQLLEHLDAIDKDRSDCIIGTCETATGETIESIKLDGRIVLKEPSNGFPPIFRIKDNANELYVSAAAKEALEKAGVQGLIFSHLYLYT